MCIRDRAEAAPLSSVDNRLRDILAVESGAASADSVAADTVAVAQASAISEMCIRDRCYPYLFSSQCICM